MKKRKPRRVRISGQLDSMTDHLKHLLNSNPGQTLEQLVPQIQRRLASRQGVSKIEKNLRRCLKKNPAFTTRGGKWALASAGNKDNEASYKLLKNKSKAMTILELQQEIDDQTLSETGLTEKQLVHDPRFVRLKQGKWALVTFEVKRYVGKKELRRIVNLINNLDKPLTLDFLAQKFFKTCPELTDLEAKLKKDKDFMQVADNTWFLSNNIPDFKAKNEATGFAAFRQAEASALQEAELLLILNDTEADSREYIVSSSDLDAGVIRISKRVEKLFKDLPVLAYIIFETDQGEVGCWYSRENCLIVGIDWWYVAQEIVPGTKIKISLLDANGSRFKLEDTGEKEAEVFSEGQRLFNLQSILRQHQECSLPTIHLVTEVMSLFPSGITEEDLSEILDEIEKIDMEALEQMLTSYPFFERLSNGCWRYNEQMKQAYEQMETELLYTKKEIEEVQNQIAATTEEARVIAGEKERLEDELYYLENHHREEELLYQEKLNQLTVENKELRQETSELRSQLEKTNKRLNQMRHQVAGAEEQAEISRQEKEMLEDKVTELENRLIQMQGYLSKTVEEMQHERARLQRKAKDLESQYENTVLANQDLHRTIEKLQIERRMLKRKLASWPVRLAVFISRLFGAK